MTSTSFVILSFAVSHGIPLAWAVRELMTTGKPAGRDGDEPPPVPERGPRPLPDCLLPQPVSGPPSRVRVRVLEDA